MAPVKTIPVAPPELPGAATKTLSQDNFAFLQRFVHQQSGITLGDEKLYLIQARLLPMLADEGLQSLDALCEALKHNPQERLRRKIVESMTTHETLFFRDPKVFEALRQRVFPDLIRRRSATRALRIWSAACSSGQEAYSIAMLLMELGRGDWNVEILGTDLSGQILEKARTGRFLQIEMNRGLPAALLVKYFQRAGLEWEIKDSLRRMVRFEHFDLRHPMFPLGSFDVVLCRNVLIYFDADTRRRILAGISGQLLPGGYLVLGASETALDSPVSLERRSLDGTTFFQKPGA